MKKTAEFLFLIRKISRAEKCLGRKDGFTLVELMVVVAIFVIVALTIFAVLIGGRRAWFISEAQLDIQSEARKAMQKMTEELSQSAPGNVAIVTISGNEDNITFRFADSYSGGAITWSDQIQYSLGGNNNQQLLRTDLDTGAVDVLANYITTLQFSQPRTDVVEIVMGLSRQSLKDDNLQLQIGSEVTLRNR